MLSLYLNQQIFFYVDLNNGVCESISIKLWKKIDFFHVGGVEFATENNVKKKVKYKWRNFLN